MVSVEAGYWETAMSDDDLRAELKRLRAERSWRPFEMISRRANLFLIVDVNESGVDDIFLRFRFTA
jgi:hypothetical protein